ncbi:uncharacterized protein ColSpa_00943 [Colletotrichum spaethianum]|uniref:Uncharacterized protein n=1 Tax=Colletotrichum spaethianum TaxID=700344 RepID=A0AA37NTD7_9PEZI|nr:uncharacterized protein ColSpa_00943 [Colletotrichum spaethianum]GKT40762.1 hypothetical protein ColSpa_00943 [Colletotrichum spaethianum]
MSRDGDAPVVEADKASVVVNEVVNRPVQNEIVVASRPNQLAVIPPGAQIINEISTTEVFPHGHVPMGFQLCTQCRRYWHSFTDTTICYRCRSSLGYRDRFDGRSSFSYGSGYGYGHGYDRCSYCERIRISEGVGHHGGIGICRDRCGRPALCRPLPRRLAYEKKTVKRYYY